MNGTANTATLKPPFALTSQLIASPSTRSTTATDHVDERNRLIEALRYKELESLHKQLWYAGRKGNVSPLHHQKVLRREIILTERAQLHLIWHEKTIYVKRLDDELLSWDIFSEVVCVDTAKALYKAACGFLLSYARLIEYPSDLEIAKSHGLVTKTIEWEDWRRFRSDILHNLANRDDHDRYEYGELRLSRLDQLHRLNLSGLTYFNVHRDYASFFGSNYVTLVALFALVSVALSAMQVMTSIGDVPATVSTTSYRFAVATLVALAASCVALLALYVLLYVWNWSQIYVRHRRARRVRATA
jgi:hypothetical protein